MILNKSLSSNTKIAVGMSGGIDSSIAAYLLKSQGYKTIGITMKIWDNSISINKTSKNGCYGPNESIDIESAGKFADKIGIPFHIIDLSKEYKQIVLKYFKSEYLNGRTPNPCVICNQKIKFRLLLEKAIQNDIFLIILQQGIMQE